MNQVILPAFLAAAILGSAVPASSGTICEVVVTTGAFDPTAHELTYRGDGTTLVMIDGRGFSGTDGRVPERRFRSIELLLGSSRFRVAAEATRDLFEPLHRTKNCTAGCSYRCDEEAPAIAVRGGDGAGAYMAVFVFSPRAGYVDRILSEHPEPEHPSLSFFTLTEIGEVGGE